MRLLKTLLVISPVFLLACGGNNNGDTGTDINMLLQESAANKDLEISAESMNAIIESIPSPVEIALIIKNSGTGFDESLINPQENSRFYNSDKSKAFSIGVYSGDLGYINIYEKSFLTVNYLTTVKKLADDISIGQFFDFELIKRLASNNDKMDSLVYLSTMNFNKMDAFLRSQKRTNMSILMVTGTWLEGFYIATQNYQDGNSPQIMEWIGNQKVIIDQLMLGLSAFRNDPYFIQVISDFNELKAIYDTITITYEYHEPESVEIDGRLVIVDKSTSKVNITEEQIDQICGIVKQIRSKLVSNA
ncbi:MAG TPA: hypothetical protein VK213_01520 [Bacteroidales bacterium]|nr:hypothetical protein [Bacteroidales bacterium]